MDGWMDGLVGALWCGGNLCVLAVGAAGESDRREWWLLLFRFAGHRVLISSDVCVGQDSMGLADGAAGESVSGCFCWN